MNSKERHLARYLRRCAKRQFNKAKIAINCDNFDQVFTISHLYQAYKKCCRNVGWKGSTQIYKANALWNVCKTYQKLQDGTFKSDGFYEFDIFERGKTRHIKSVTIRERVVQRCLCDYSLTPMLSRQLIFDNGASTKGKGYTFAQNRLKKMLHHYYSRFHTNKGYVLLYDFSKFFDSLRHSLLKGIIYKTYNDKRLIKLICHFIDMFGNGKGIGLGSQISQNLALISVNKLDHYMKEKMRIWGYGRYMDDGYLIHNDKEYLQSCLAELRKLSNELGVTINECKTHITKLDKGFTYLKIHFRLTESGKVVERLSHDSAVRMRRKLKKFKTMIDTGKMTIHDVYQSYQSWDSHARPLNSFRTRVSMYRLYKKLFGGQKCSIKF